MSSSKLELSLASGNHKKLNSIIGEWTGQTKTWFEPGDPIDDSPMSGTIRPLFDGRFLLHEYKGILQDQPFEGIAILWVSHENRRISICLDGYLTYGNRYYVFRRKEKWQLL